MEINKTNAKETNSGGDIKPADKVLAAFKNVTTQLSQKELAALNVLIQQYLETSDDIRVVCPSLALLEQHLELRALGEEDLETAQMFCYELANHAHCLAQFKVEISRMSGFTDRILLYDGKHLQVRVHLFVKGAKESFIHDHQTSFISCCIQGSYLHKIHAVEMTDGKHYALTRKTGGIYSEEPEEKEGTLSNVLAQPFEQGQSLFLSAMASHTVEPKGEEQVVTVVFKEKKSRKDGTTVLSPTKEFENELNKQEDLTNREQKAVLSTFERIIRQYLIRPASLAAIDSNLKQTKEVVDQIHGMVKGFQFKETKDVLLLTGYFMMITVSSTLPADLKPNLQGIIDRLKLHIALQHDYTFANKKEFSHQISEGLDLTYRRIYRHVMHQLGAGEGFSFYADIQTMLETQFNFPVLNKKTPEQKQKLIMEWLQEFLNKNR